METSGNLRKRGIRLKSCKGFHCEACDYVTLRKWSMDKHVLTAKHRKNSVLHEKLQKLQKSCKNDYGCRFCEKKFKTRSGAWKHGQKCLNNPVILKKKFVSKMAKKNLKIKEKNLKIKEKNLKIEEVEKKLMQCDNYYLMKENETLKKELERHKATPHTQNINTQHNININFFLNEKCKDAMSIMDFIKELQFTLTDINPERPASTIESLSKVIVEKLGDMAETERPVHCSDAKRLNFYVKDASGWTKDEDNKKIDKAIGWANMRHQGAWYDRIKDEGLAQTEKDTTYHTMNVAMAKFSDDPQKAKRKIKRAIAGATNLKDAKQL